MGGNIRRQEQESAGEEKITAGCESVKGDKRGTRTPWCVFWSQWKQVVSVITKNKSEFHLQLKN